MTSIECRIVSYRYPGVDGVFSSLQFFMKRTWYHEIIFIRKEKCCCYNSPASLEYRYITKYWLHDKLCLYRKRELAGGTILPKVTILQSNNKRALLAWNTILVLNGHYWIERAFLTHKGPHGSKLNLSHIILITVSDRWPSLWLDLFLWRLPLIMCVIKEMRTDHPPTVTVCMSDGT